MISSGETRRLSVRYAFAPPDLVIVYTEDITDRERAARELRESEERFRQIYQQQAVGVARVSLDFRILGANRAYCDMLGYSEEELIGRSLADITLADDQAENIAQQTALGKGLIDHYRMEKRFVHRSGEIIMGVLDANLVHDADGQPAHFLGSVVDITELRRTMRELEQRNDELTRFNRAATGRELRMIELKQEINALCEQLGRQRPYPLEAMQSKEPR